MRLLVVVGLIALNAAVDRPRGAAPARWRASPWVFPRSRRGLARCAASIAWLLPAVVARAWPGVADDRAPLVPTLVAVGVHGAPRRGCCTAIAPSLRHGSQATRLLLSFLALVLPSVVLYPSLVDAAARARRQLVEARYAPEVHEPAPGRAAQAAARRSPRSIASRRWTIWCAPAIRRASGPPPTDAAFLVWSQTSLATQRLTSSVELHNASGAMVSRFALKLPDITQPQPWSESSCDWEILEEVSPFFSEERRLLHAGSAICIVGPDGRAAPGRSSCTSMLDYGNLSFISAQNPYVALMRSGQPRPEPRPRADVEFYVYGWSRRVLYSSGRDARRR